MEEEKWPIAILMQKTLIYKTGRLFYDYENISLKGQYRSSKIHIFKIVSLGRSDSSYYRSFKRGVISSDFNNLSQTVKRNWKNSQITSP